VGALTTQAGSPCDSSFTSPCPWTSFNEAVRDGTAGSLEETKPEAVYFCAQDRKRSGFLVVNMSDASEMPRFAEPWFLQFDAGVEFMPAMTPQDLARGGLDDLGKKWK
jgi:hypothetical protein